MLTSRARDKKGVKTYDRRMLLQMIPMQSCIKDETLIWKFITGKNYLEATKYVNKCGKAIMSDYTYIRFDSKYCKQNLC